MKFLSDMTTSAKVSLAMKAIGLTSTETGAVDGLIADIGAHPIVVFATGREYSSLKDVVTTGVEMAASDERIPHLDTVGTFLANPSVRDSVAELIMGFIEKSKDRVSLTQALEKVAELPIQGIHDYEYKTHREFLSAGVLGLMSHKINELPSVTPEPNLATCPHCDGVFYN